MVMGRVLVVHHDIDIADQEADSLRRLGYQVEQCTGPSVHACPILQGQPCPAVERADVLVYDVWSTSESDGGRRLIEGIRELHPEVPVVLTAPGMELDWVATEGPHRVVPLVGAPNAERLAVAIEEAVGASAPHPGLPASN
jgi:hypothetical protein